MEMHQELTERGDLLKNSSRQFFLKFNCFVTDGSFTADSSLLCTTGCVSTTPQRNRFRGAEMYNKRLQERIDDHNIQSDNKYKSGLKVRIQ